MPDDPPNFEEALSETLLEFQEAMETAFHRLQRLDMMLQFKLKMNRAEHVDDGPLKEVIFGVLQHCQASGQLTRLLVGAHDFTPDNPRLKRLFIQYFPPADRATGAGSDAIDKLEPMTRLPQMYRIDWLSQVVRNSASCVARIENQGSFGTGFLVASDLILTCNHVLNLKSGGDMEVFFQALSGDPTEDPRVLRLPASNSLVAFSLSRDLNYSLIRLDAPVGDELVNGAPRGWLTLSAAPPADRTNLVQIHYPNGGAISASFVSMQPGGSSSRIAYEYATRPGSGGAPSLDHSRQVVAMHEKRSPNGKQGEGISSAEIVQDLARRGVVLPQFEE